MLFSNIVQNSWVAKVSTVLTVLALVASAFLITVPNVASASVTEDVCDFAGGVWDTEDNRCEDANGEELSHNIICAVFELLHLPLPDYCDDDSEPSDQEECEEDGGYWNGSLCEEVAECDEDETYNEETNECITNENPDDGNNGGNNGGSNGGSSGGGGGSSRGSSGGSVLGASTDSSCGPLLSTYLRMGKQNDLAEVVKLQLFLQDELGLTNLVTGSFDAATKIAVDQFQLKYADEVLAPWIVFGLPSKETPTSYVYKTTQRMINNIHCATLNLPVPQLP